MRFTNRTKIKGKRERGYYWIVWSMETKTEPEIRKVGFYNDRLEQWYLPGDQRAYVDSDFVGIYDHPVDEIPGIRFTLRLIVGIAFFIILWHLTGYVKFLIDHIFK